MGRTLGVYGANDASGWTSITSSPDVPNDIVVSSTDGHDSNSGASQTPNPTNAGGAGAAGPFKTLGKAMTVLNAQTSNKPYHVTLKETDTWTDETFGRIQIAGRSADEPLVIGTYGGTGVRAFIKTKPSIMGGNAAIWTGGAAPSTANGDHIALMNLDLYQYTRDPDNPSYAGVPSDTLCGLQFLMNYNSLLIENCKFGFYNASNIILQPNGTAENAIIRRNVIVDAYDTVGAHSQGLSIQSYGGAPDPNLRGFGCNSYIVEENVLDHNGWNASVAGAGRNQFNHNMYCLNNAMGQVIVRGNMLARGSSHGAKIQAGGNVYDNFCPENAIGILMGAFIVGQNSCRFNVIWGSTDIDGGNPRGWGIDLANTSNPGGTYFASGGPLEVSDNIVANFTGTNQLGIRLYTNLTQASVRRNVIRNAGSGGNRLLDVSGGVNTIGSGADANEIDLAGYNSPDRALSDLSTFIGGAGTAADYYAQARLQSKANWRKEYTAAFACDFDRGGFGRRKMLGIRTGS